jgi:hypothetical protein
MYNKGSGHYIRVFGKKSFFKLKNWKYAKKKLFCGKKAIFFSKIKKRFIFRTLISMKWIVTHEEFLLSAWN